MILAITPSNMGKKNLKVLMDDIKRENLVKLTDQKMWQSDDHYVTHEEKREVVNGELNLVTQYRLPQGALVHRVPVPAFLVWFPSCRCFVYI